jgi:hypothetical protein
VNAVTSAVNSVDATLGGTLAVTNTEFTKLGNLSNLNIALSTVNTAVNAVTSAVNSVDATLGGTLVVSNSEFGNLGNLANLNIALSSVNAAINQVNTTLNGTITVDDISGSTGGGEVSNIHLPNLSNLNIPLSTVNSTLTNGVTVSQSTAASLKVETTPSSTSIQIGRGESIISEYVADGGNGAKFPVTGACRLHGLYYGFADSTSGVFALYDAISTMSVTSSSTPSLVVYMKGNTNQNLSFPGPIEFTNGIAIRSVVGTSASGTSDLGPNHVVTFYLTMV